MCDETSILIRNFAAPDIPIIMNSFASANWPKPASTFERYLQEQQKSERIIWVAHVDNQLAGYVTLKWKSQYEQFANSNIPEIMDLNVLPGFRNRGVGSQLLEVAEKEALTKSNVVGIGAGLYKDYGAAQKLYVKRGYVPDGNGVTYNYKTVNPGSSTITDDNLVLWFTKK